MGTAEVVRALFCAIAGIWPFARGRVAHPAGAMFIPQRAYFPNDSLCQALTDALLPHLAERLDEKEAWGQKL